MRRLLILALVTAIPASVRAQGSVPPAWPDSTAGFPQGALPAEMFLPDSLVQVADSDVHPPAILPEPRPQFLRAVGELMILNAAAVGINKLARDIPTTRPETWWQNIKGGWEWDANYISTNNIEHPYAGAVYYNIARANHMSFWASAPVTVAGSVIWELFGEPAAPAINDVIITSLSGITLGEATRRLSWIVLDNEATGINRVWREASVLLLNPGMGLDRLSRGQTWHQRPNPAEHRPGNLRATVAAGARRYTLTGGSPDSYADRAMLAFALQYGDPFTETRDTPFSFFTFTAELNSGPPTTLTEMGTRGLIAALGRRDGATRQVSGIFMEFEYQWNEAWQFSEQAFGLGLLSRTSGNQWAIDTDVSAELLPLVASSDPYAQAAVRRSYDFGMGVGGRAFAHVEYRGFRVLSAGYRGFWTATVNGASQTKLMQFVTVEARAPLPFGLAAGAAYTLYLQRSTYAERSGATVSLPSLSVFISTSGR